LEFTDYGEGVHSQNKQYLERRSSDLEIANYIECVLSPITQ